MPRELSSVGNTPMSLAEATSALDDGGFDPRDEFSLLEAAEILAALGRNKTFLGDLLIERMERGDPEASAYGPQAIMLSEPRNGYFLRANIWPARGDTAFRASGSSSFVYDLAHDHNFDFLTVGYFGPGYESDYWEYDYASVQGEVSEPVDLRFVERSCLSPGRVLHYRAHRDVHCQHPPQSLSVSLNICAAGPALGWFDQYSFDTEAGRIAGRLNPTANEVALRMAVALGRDDAQAFARDVAENHPVERMREAACEALAANKV